MKNVARFDKGTVKGDAVVTPEGYIRANAVVTRTGIFDYQNPDGTVRKELRHPEDIWTSDSIESMEMIPITNGHPQERLVTSENFRRLGIGFTGQSIKRDGEHVMANLVITDKEAVEAIQRHNRKELSLGYTVDLEEEPGVYQGQRYDARQRNVRYNHLAIVDRARAGEAARIVLDSDDAIEFLKEVSPMTKRSIKVDNVEYMAEESVADYVSRLEKDLKNLQDEKSRVDDEIKMIRDKLEKAEAERDSMSDKVEALPNGTAVVALDSAEFKKAVSERLQIVKLAEKRVPKATNLDSMSNQQIKKLVIGECRKSIKLDGKSDGYIDAMFDTIVDEQVKAEVNLDNVSYNTDSQVNDGSRADVGAAQKRMMEKQQNLHKQSATSGGK